MAGSTRSMPIIAKAAAGAGLLAALAPLVAPRAAADPLSDFYRGRQLQMIIGTGPGGDYDNRARLLARHMGRHIPGEPTFIASNMPGAVGVAAANWLANLAPRDGTVVHAIMQNMPVHQATGGQGVKFDATRFGWIGSTTDSPNLISAWHTTGITRIEQVLTQELVVGAPGTATASVYYPQSLNMLIGTRFKIVSGYPGGNNVNIAMERGEVGGRGANSLAAWHATKPDWLRERKIVHLVQVGLKRHPELPDVPLLFELARNDADRQLLLFLSSDVPLSRAFVTTPEVPLERLQALRHAFAATMKDQAFLAEAARSQIDISPITGEEAQAIVAGIVGASPEIRARARQIFEGTPPR